MANRTAARPTIYPDPQAMPQQSSHQAVIPTQIEVGPQVAATIQRQQQAVLKQEYQPLGKADFIFTTRGKIDFRKMGFMLGLARHPAGEDLVAVSPWPGLPDVDEMRQHGEHIVVVQSACTACRAKCDECAGTGKRNCTVCGGDGISKLLYKLCVEPGCAALTGKFNPECKTCSGTGQLVDPRECRGCTNGKAACGLCQGTGQWSTGTLKGSLGRNAPTCPECNGNGRVNKTRPQPLKDFVHGRLGDLIVLGPIESIVWHTPGTGSHFESCQIVPDKQGNLMVLVLDHANPGSRIYLIGGVPIFGN